MTEKPEKLWSHTVAQNPAETDPRELEALSRRYGNATLLLLPLRDGSFALFGNDRQLIALYDSLPDAETFRATSLAAEARLHTKVLAAHGGRNPHEPSEGRRTPSETPAQILEW